MKRVGLFLGTFMLSGMLILAASAEEGGGVYDLAFVSPGRWDSSYYLIDTDSNKVLYFDIADDLVMEEEYTGDFSNGAEIDWSAYDTGWHDQLVYNDGDSTATITDENGASYEIEVCDVETAQQVLEGKSGYENISDAEPVPAAEKEENPETAAAEEENEDAAEEDSDSGKSLNSWVKYYAKRGIDVRGVDADILYQYAEYYSGATVYTAFTVSSTSSGILRTDTESNSSFFHYSVVCNFEDESEIEGIEDDDIVAVIGTSSGDSYSTLSDCHLVATGKKAKKLMNSLSEDTAEQIDYAMSVKADLEADQIAQDEAEKQAYIDGCVSVDYSEVERNPDAYKDMNIQVSGSVIQVSEGWFNSVTLRVQQSDGNIWYVTYSRDDGESRILEGDYVTLYGTCDGVESYTSILGEKITIPSLKAKYIN